MADQKRMAPNSKPALRAGLWLVVVLAIPTSTPAQPTKLGPEFAVNEVFAGNQYFPAVAKWRDRAYVVVWNGAVDQDSDGLGIYGRLVNRNGATVGKDFRVNDTVTGNQGYPGVQPLPGGGFVVAWQNDFSPTDEAYGIVAQRYDSDGLAIGGEFQVNAETLGDQRYLAIGGAAADGSFVVVWESNAGQAPDQTEIMGRRFNSSGQGLSSEFQVNTFSTDEQLLPSVSGTPDGAFVVVWQSYGNSDGAGSGVRGQRYDSNGGRIGGEFEVNTYTTYNEGGAVVDSAPDGSFVVAWDAYRSPASNYEVFARRFGSDGKALGDEFQVNTQTTNYQHAPSVRVRADGSFLVLWSSDARLGLGRDDIQGQLYDRQGQLVGGEFQVNSTTSGAHFYPRSTEADGRLLSVWQGRVPPDSDGSGIGAQLYELPPLPVPSTSTGWLVVYATTVIAICARFRDVVRLGGR